MTCSTTLDLHSVHNFRALAAYELKGGGTIRPGRIYRSGALDLITDDDARYLSATCEIVTVLDLRHPDEFAGSTVGHPLAGRVTPISMFPESQGQEALIAELNGLYGTGPSPERYLHYLSVAGPRILRAFELFAREEAYPVLVHCTAGKDRTGVLLGMLMDVLGARDEDIASEYGLSDASLDRLIAYLESSGRVLEGTREEIRARLSTPPDRMSGFIDLMRARYGGAAAYLAAEGLDPAAITRIREILTAR